MKWERASGKRVAQSNTYIHICHLHEMTHACKAFHTSLQAHVFNTLVQTLHELYYCHVLVLPVFWLFVTPWWRVVHISSRSGGPGPSHSPPPTHLSQSGASWCGLAPGSGGQTGDSGHYGNQATPRHISTMQGGEEAHQCSSAHTPSLQPPTPQTYSVSRDQTESFIKQITMPFLLRATRTVAIETVLIYPKCCTEPGSSCV